MFGGKMNKKPKNLAVELDNAIYWNVEYSIHGELRCELTFGLDSKLYTKILSSKGANIYMKLEDQLQEDLNNE